MRISLLAASLGVLSLSAALPLAAQAPVITPNGDPSVRSDTIYKLAVKPADYPDESYVYLLDDGVVRREANGTGTRTFRQVVQILTDDAVDDMREQSFSYSPRHQKLTINWIRVLKLDGTVISSAPTHIQDADIPAEMGDPVYTDEKVKRVSLTGVEPNTIVDFSYTLEELKPYHPNDFLEHWGFSTSIPTFRSRFIVDVPATMHPLLRERNLTFARQTTTAHGRTVYTWATNKIPKIKREFFQPDSDNVIMHITVGAPMTWGSIANWYAENAKDRYTPTPKLRAKVHELVANAKTQDDSIRAVYRWVAQDIRYVSIALDMGGFQPRMPDTVMATGFGDCKDKATLFIAALRDMGVEAYPVLLSSSGYVLRGLPSYTQFDHVIAAVKRPSGYQYADLTATTQPYGEVMASYQGEFGVVVLPNGKSEEITFPQSGVADNVDSTMITGTLTETGIFSGRYTEWASGTFAQGIRQTFATPFDSTQRANFSKAIARRYFQNAMGDSLLAFNGKDLSAVPEVSVRITNGKAGTLTGGTMILTFVGAAGAAANMTADELEAAPKRVFPIDAKRFMGLRQTVMRYRIRLPAGWTAKLPPNVNATSPFATYIAEYAMDGNVLQITHRMRGAEGVYPPDQIKSVIAWFRAMGQDDVKFIMLEKAASK